MAPKRPSTGWTPKRLKALRERLGLTQAALAERLGVTARAIIKWESGENTPTGPAAKLLDIFDAERK